jgi:hypothetical protein
MNESAHTLIITLERDVLGTDGTNRNRPRVACALSFTPCCACISGGSIASCSLLCIPVADDALSPHSFRESSVAGGAIRRWPQGFAAMTATAPFRGRTRSVVTTWRTGARVTTVAHVAPKQRWLLSCPSLSMIVPDRGGSLSSSAGQAARRRGWALRRPADRASAEESAATAYIPRTAGASRSPGRGHPGTSRQMPPPEPGEHSAHVWLVYA